MKIIIEANGYRLELDEEMFESFGLSIPSDVFTDADGAVELARAHVALTALFKEGVRPEWKEITSE